MIEQCSFEKAGLAQIRLQSNSCRASRLTGSRSSDVNFQPVLFTKFSSILVSNISLIFLHYLPNSFRADRPRFKQKPTPVSWGKIPVLLTNKTRSKSQIRTFLQQKSEMLHICQHFREGPLHQIFLSI